MENKFSLNYAKKWIAGEELRDAFSVISRENENGIFGMINYLDEHLKSYEFIENNYFEYQKIITKINNSGQDINISIKPSQLGLEVSKELFLENMLNLRKKADSTMIWIDMEKSSMIEDTIWVYGHLDTKNTGIALQANVDRSLKDIEDLLSIGSKIRIVKGSYAGKDIISNKIIISENYRKMMHYLLENSSFFALATHDEVLINECIELNKNFKIDIEYQFLYGVKFELKRKLAEGFNVRDYIPYGKKWAPYILRRMKEIKNK
ncbi:MAG: proline dehydrogenase family protein [Candidatus Methanofastidiosum sp.]|nr:proline dehydrogenase family protein [Methanofastidiosum sp.]